MIRSIVAIDSKRGLANEQGIPWQLPSDQQYFREQTLHRPIVMGYGVYQEMKQPLPDRQNLVATSKTERLRPGFSVIHDVETFLRAAKEDVWVIGGAGLYQSTLELTDELYITQLQGDFNCTKFFPEIAEKFELVSQSPDHIENEITFCYQIWRRRGLSKN